MFAFWTIRIEMTEVQQNHISCQNHWGLLPNLHLDHHWKMMRLIPKTRKNNFKNIKILFNIFYLIYFTLYNKNISLLSVFILNACLQSAPCHKQYSESIIKSNASGKYTKITVAPFLLSPTILYIFETSWTLYLIRKWGASSR